MKALPSSKVESHEWDEEYAITPIEHANREGNRLLDEAMKFASMSPTEWAEYWQENPYQDSDGELDFSPPGSQEWYTFCFVRRAAAHKERARNG